MDRTTDAVRAALASYAEPLLRQVAGRLVNPRTLLRADELADKAVATLANPPVIDRRLRGLPPVGRKLLALIAQSGQPRWRVASLVELAASVDEPAGIAPVQALLEEGLLYPADAPPDLADFAAWLAQGLTAKFSIFAHPGVAARAAGEDLGLPELPPAGLPPAEVLEADGLDVPLRLAALWQEIAETPLRLTQQGGLFKRDAARLKADPLVNVPPAGAGPELPDAVYLLAALAAAAGLVVRGDGELTAGDFPASWQDDWAAPLAALWASLPLVENWNPAEGWTPEAEARPSYAAPVLLLVLTLARQPAGRWVALAAAGRAVCERHPLWASWAEPDAGWAEAVALNVLYPLGMVQLGRGGDGWQVRLTDFGRSALKGTPDLGPRPAVRQTLLVQPNGEVIVYRQGLTPRLTAELSGCARWKVIGSACQMELNPAWVYRGLESGFTFDSLVQTLNRHGMRPVPDPVLGLLKTWANKRERITVYASATLIEFASPAELEDALARGAVRARLSERIGLVADESGVDYRHFRVVGNRDYESPPEKCVRVEDDGLTLTVDAVSSDLLLDSELARLADPLPGDGMQRRRARITQPTLKRAFDAGQTAFTLDQWFRDRCGQDLPPAVRLLAAGLDGAAVEFGRRIVLEVPSAELADGVLQWPATRELIERRLGPTALLVAEANADAVRQRLASIGVEVLPFSEARP